MKRYSNRQYFLELGFTSMDIEQRKEWLYGQFHQSTEAQSNSMKHYKEFCQLRDYRKHGAEVTLYSEAEAFAMAAASHQSELERFINNDAYTITCQSIEQYRAMLKSFIATQIKPKLKCYLCSGETKLCAMNCGLAMGDTRSMVEVRRQCGDCMPCHVCDKVDLTSDASRQGGAQ